MDFKFDISNIIIDHRRNKIIYDDNQLYLLV